MLTLSQGRVGFLKCTLATDFGVHRRNVQCKRVGRGMVVVKKLRCKSEVGQLGTEGQRNWQHGSREKKFCPEFFAFRKPEFFVFKEHEAYGAV